MTDESADRVDGTLRRRRDPLKIGAAAARAAVAFGPTDLFAAMMVPRELSLLNLHTGESLTARYWAHGRYQRDVLKRINWLLRDHRTGTVHAIDPRLLDLAYTLHRRVGAHAPFHVVSGYRTPQTNALLAHMSDGVAANSYHMRGMALDIRLPGYSISRLHQAALHLNEGGVGYYPESDFVHVDVGPVRRW